MNAYNNQHNYQKTDSIELPNSINQDSKTPFNQFHNNNQFYDNQIQQPSSHLQQPQENNDNMQFSKNNTPFKNEKPSSSFCSILFSTKTSLIILTISIILVIILLIFEDEIKDFFKIKIDDMIEILFDTLLCFILLSIVILSIRFIIFLFRKCLKYD
ncbi:hypothetical protein HERIO_287 [Hepatospora eriocheir]|uniref:Transmembrane protein n=1 Tax=Hepatospora eriocheir TaxID=1081669 RepID=A0A1X0QDR5_9MICR|nr:hypothetical protein HERIO_287 [Hepatospora eriocheir]